MSLIERFHSYLSCNSGDEVRRARVLNRYEAQEENELTLESGQVRRVVCKWVCWLANGVH